MNINVSRYVTPKQLLCQPAVITAMQSNHNSCDEKFAYVNAYVNFQVGAHVLKLNRGLLFARKLVNINVSMSADQKLALVSASHNNCNKM